LFSKPANKIVAVGEPLVDECKVENITNMYPGRLVKKGTTDDDIVVNDAQRPLGWLGYEHTHAEFRPDDVDSQYKANAWAAVLFGKGFIVVGRLASGQNVTKGDLLVAAANGEVKKASVMDGSVDSGTTTVTSTAANGDIITLSGGVAPEGPIVGRAVESVDATTEAKDILIESWI